MKLQKIFTAQVAGKEGSSYLTGQTSEVELCEFDPKQWVELRVKDNRGVVEHRIVPLANIRYAVVDPGHLKMAKARGGKAKPVED